MASPVHTPCAAGMMPFPQGPQFFLVLPGHVHLGAVGTPHLTGMQLRTTAPGEKKAGCAETVSPLTSATGM